MIEWLPWLPSKSCYTNLKFFETLKDTPNPSKGFRFEAFLVLEILGGVLFDPPPPWCLVWVPKPLVPGGLNFQLSSSEVIEVPMLVIEYQLDLPIISYNVMEELLTAFDLSDTDTVTDANISLLLGSFPETSFSNIKALVNLIQENRSTDLSSMKGSKKTVHIPTGQTVWLPCQSIA